MKSQNSPYSINLIDKIKAARLFAKTLKRLKLIPLSESQVIEVTILISHGAYEQAELLANIPAGFGLKDCKQYVERLYTTKGEHGKFL